MVNLYEYDKATKEECEEDLEEITEYLEDCVRCDFQDELDVIEKKGYRIIEIAKRLKELGEEDD